MAKGDQEEQSILEATTTAGKSSPLKDLKYLMDLLSVFSFPYLSPAVLRKFRTFLYGHLR
jgi:hypothetical protein